MAIARKPTKRAEFGPMIRWISAIEKMMLNDFSSCSRTTRSAKFWSVENEIVRCSGSASQIRRALISV